MILVEVKLLPGGSSDPERVVVLGTVVIDRVAVREDGRRADYRVRSWKRGETLLDFRYGKPPLREAVVTDHARKSLPVLTLVAKALRALGYSK